MWKMSSVVVGCGLHQLHPVVKNTDTNQTPLNFGIPLSHSVGQSHSMGQSVIRSARQFSVTQHIRSATEHLSFRTAEERSYDPPPFLHFITFRRLFASSVTPFCLLVRVYSNPIRYTGLQCRQRCVSESMRDYQHATFLTHQPTKLN